MEIFKDVEQGSEKWMEIRAWVLTGTKLGWIIWWEKAQQTMIFQLIWEEFAPIEDWYKSFAMQRWNEMEPIARAKYIELTWEKVKEVWFIKKNSFLGLSPDWVIYNWEIIRKAIEIKSPWAKNHTKYILEDKIPEEYLRQIVMYFVVISELEEIDFISYNWEFYIKSKQLWIKNIKREDLIKEIEEAQKRIITFREKWLKYIKKLIS